MKFRVWLAGMALAIGWVAAGPGWAVDFQIGAISIDAPWATGARCEIAGHSAFILPSATMVTPID
jgi:hypothetical protein